MVDRVNLIVDSGAETGSIVFSTSTSPDNWREELLAEPYRTQVAEPAILVGSTNPTPLEGSYWWRIRWNQEWPLYGGNKYRSEIKRPQQWFLENNNKYWIGFAIFIKDNANNRANANRGADNNHCIQWHFIGDNGTSGINIRNGNWMFSVGTLPEENIGAVEFNKWNRFVIEIDVQNNNTGMCRAWLNADSENDTPVYEHLNVANTLNTSGLNPKLGIYTGTQELWSNGCTYIEYYYDSYRVGNSNSNWASVNPGETTIVTPENPGIINSWGNDSAGSFVTSGGVTVDGATVGARLGCIAYHRNGSNATVTETTGNWTEVAEYDNGTHLVRYYERTATGDTSDDIAFASVLTRAWSAVVFELTGVVGTASLYPHDVDGFPTGSVTSVSTGAGAPSAAPAFAMCWGAFKNQQGWVLDDLGSGLNTPAGFTTVLTQYTQVADMPILSVGYQELADTSSVSGTYSTANVGSEAGAGLLIFETGSDKNVAVDNALISTQAYKATVNAATTIPVAAGSLSLSTYTASVSGGGVTPVLPGGVSQETKEILGKIVDFIEGIIGG